MQELRTAINEIRANVTALQVQTAVDRTVVAGIATDVTEIKGAVTDLVASFNQAKGAENLVAKVGKVAPYVGAAVSGGGVGAWLTKIWHG